MHDASCTILPVIVVEWRRYVKVSEWVVARQKVRQGCAEWTLRHANEVASQLLSGVACAGKSIAEILEQLEPREKRDLAQVQILKIR